MNTKLTLTVQKSVIKKAKQFAKSEGRSLSSIIENYLKAITANKDFEEIKDTPITDSLRGSVKVPEGFDFDYKKAILEERSKKFLK